MSTICLKSLCRKTLVDTNQQGIKAQDHMTLKGSTFYFGRRKPNVHLTTLIFFLNFQDQSTIYCIIEYDVLTLSKCT
jgi:hypothetical protein